MRRQRLLPSFARSLKQAKKRPLPLPSSQKPRLSEKIGGHHAAQQSGVVSFLFFLLMCTKKSTAEDKPCFLRKKNSNWAKGGSGHRRFFWPQSHCVSQIGRLLWPLLQAPLFVGSVTKIYRRTFFHNNCFLSRFGCNVLVRGPTCTFGGAPTPKRSRSAPRRAQTQGRRSDQRPP